VPERERAREIRHIDYCFVFFSGAPSLLPAILLRREPEDVVHCFDSFTGTNCAEGQYRLETGTYDRVCAADSDSVQAEEEHAS
jgi:hypothetical protein